MARVRCLVQYSDGSCTHTHKEPAKQGLILIPSLPMRMPVSLRAGEDKPGVAARYCQEASNSSWSYQWRCRAQFLMPLSQPHNKTMRPILSVLQMSKLGQGELAGMHSQKGCVAAVAGVKPGLPLLPQFCLFGDLCLSMCLLWK